jgi:ABC-type multidrug transport system ATPase subunit
MLDDTKIIKLDEPTVGLNPAQIIDVKEILLKNKGSE